MFARCLLSAALVGCAPLASPLAAQSAEPSRRAEWNTSRVRSLVAAARDVRQSVSVDSSFSTYQAQARGYVYFFIDRPDEPDHVLVKADQVALDLFWRAPDRTKQRIVGRRDEKVLPTDIRYHLDHLTVVQDDFGDRIRLGDGDEVAAVTHPVAPGAEEVYDYALVDSLSLTYGVEQREVRVYEIRVRPKALDRPGYIGTIFLDRTTSAVVRMNFSFTPASYVDPYLDYIRISLDNSLWLGRFWLPYRQEVELRREMPILDFSAGSVIRSRFDIEGYDFNVDLPPSVFFGSRVSTVSPAERAAFPFERGLFDDLGEEGLTISTTMEDVRTQVREVVEEEVLSGLSPVRLHLDGLSDFARYNRAEGAFVGGGVTLRPRGDARVRALAGYAFGRRQPSGSLSLSGGGRLAPRLRGYWDDLADVGGNPGASLLVNTISAASGDKDYLDPYFTRGATLRLGASGGPTLSLSWAEHRSARDVVSDGPEPRFRPVLSVHEGTLVDATVMLPFATPGGGDARLTARGGRLDSRTLLAGVLEADWRFGPGRDRWHADLALQGGATNPRGPAQALFLIGGRQTLPGHDYRAFAGSQYGLARAVVTLPVRPPYVGIRFSGAAGATRLGRVDLPADWAPTDSDGVRGSLGLGLSLGWDSIFLDVSHGVRGGGWEAVVSVSERFEGWM